MSTQKQIAFNHDAVRGVTSDQDLNPSLVNRDIRPLKYRFYEAMSSYGGWLLVAVGIMIGATSLVGGGAQYVSDALLLFLLPISPMVTSRKREYPFRAPILPDAHAPGLDDDSGGQFFLGNDLFTGAAGWLSGNDMKTHMLVFGSTGSGKTRFLLGMFYQALLVGSGAMYVDGKGDNTVFWLAYTLCRRLGRDDDLLVINYLVGDTTKAKAKGPSLRRISHTSNMLATGDAEQLRSLIVGLMREVGGDGAMWKGRASAMLQALFRVLCHLRDEGEIKLDVEKLREYMPLDTILRLYQRTDLPESSIRSILRYLADLPGFTEEAAMSGKLNAEAYKQHGFLMMQLTEVLADLSDTYGHIFNAPMGEVDFKDVVFNGRILFVMLPALQKDPDALEGLGKMVVAGVRAALAPALGDSVEGSYEEVIASKPSNSKVPFLIILDEYGYYAVKGFAVVAAQARSLGVSVIFAGQDYPSFKRASEEEAASTVANTNTKIGMKNEDANETAEVMINRASDAEVVKTSGSNAKDTMAYKDNLEARVETKKRISVRDLANQKPGQAHILNGDVLSRAQLFFANPKDARSTQISRFAMVNEPSEEVVQRIRDAYKKAKDLARGAIDRASKASEQPPRQASNESFDDDVDEGIAQLAKDIQLAKDRRQNISEAALFAVGLIPLRNNLKDKEQLEGLAGPETEATRKSAGAKDVAEAQSSKVSANSGPERGGTTGTPDLKAGDQSGASEGVPSGSSPDQHLAVIDDAYAPGPNDSVRTEAETHRSAFLERLRESSISTIRTSLSRPLTAEEERRSNPEETLLRAAGGDGALSEGAVEEKDEGVEILSRKVSYIHEPLPAKLDRESLERRLQDLSEGARSEDGDDGRF